MQLDKLKAFFRLVRWENLLMIALAQELVRQFIIKPEIFNYKAFLNLTLNEWQFVLVITATLLIAAAGYIINDYFDLNTDAVNKPFRITIGKFFTRKQVFRMHLLFNVVGSILGLYAGWLCRNWQIGLVFPICAGLLWFYAKSFKRQFLIGNLIVSFLTGLAVFLPYLFETGLFSGDEIASAASHIILQNTGAYAFFAFLTTLIREIIKDMQDYTGDEQYGCRTLPIVWGMKAAKSVLLVLALLLIGSLIYLQALFFQSNEFLKIGYILVTVQAPVFSLIFALAPASGPDDFKKLSERMKLIMFFGIISIAVFYFIK